MPANGDVVQVELVWSTHPSTRSPTALKRSEDGPEKASVLDKGLEVSTDWIADVSALNKCLADEHLSL